MREILIDREGTEVSIMYESTAISNFFRVYVNGQIVLDRVDGSIDSADVTRVLQALGIRYKIVDPSKKGRFYEGNIRD